MLVPGHVVGQLAPSLKWAQLCVGKDIAVAVADQHEALTHGGG